ncbi:MAG TPA: hypothetical protein VFG54_17630 [Prolixibacteraceae bacterium]|nr:hypothetical protein [Prolixibacteraceae bacterium]
MQNLKILLIFFVFISVYCTSQESKSDLVISGTVAHYQRSGQYSGVPGTFKYPVDPGLEVLYQYRVGNSFFLMSGLSYQYGRISSWKEADNRFRFGEISLPFYLKQILIKSDKLSLYTSFGLSYGKMLNLDWEVPNKGSGWGDVDRQQNEHYSEKNAFADLLFDLGVSFPVSDHNAIAISPYVKYRLKDYWMEYYRKDLYYGIKISYQLNLGKNEE